MAAHSNRSASPLSSRPNNPNPQNTVNNSSTRRSSNNNPYPSFMSPTISAALKFTPKPRKKFLVDRNDPKPRKKVLVDRNDHVRTSISLCDGKGTFFSEIWSDENQFKESCIDSHVVQEAPPPVNKPSKRVTFTEVSSAYSHHVSGSLSESVIDCIAPLDADPYLPDPKINYITEVSSAYSHHVSESLSESVIDCIAPFDADPYFPDPRINYLLPQGLYTLWAMLMCVLLLMLLIIAWLSDLSNFYHQSLVVVDSEEVNFDRIAMKVNELSFSPMASISKPIDSNLGNITDLEKNILNGGHFMDNHLSNEWVDNFEEEDELEEEAFEAELEELWTEDEVFEAELEVFVDSQTEVVVSNEILSNKNSEEIIINSLREGFKSEKEFLGHYHVIVLSSLFMAVAVGGVRGAFLYKWKKNAPSADMQKQQVSRNWQTEDVDVVGGSSCPSETLSSSSEYPTTPKYGRFTTYETIPMKNANGDERIITFRVSRSRRIRTRITSPLRCC